MEVVGREGAVRQSVTQGTVTQVGRAGSNTAQVRLSVTLLLLM